MKKLPLKVFISFKWEDDEHNKWVENFAADLIAAGIDAKLYQWEVHFGDSLTDYMTSQIKEADAVLFIITGASIAAAEGATSGGSAVRFEVQMATSRRIAGERMRFIGILREGRAAPAHLRDHRYADFRNDAEYSVRFRELVDDLLGKVRRPSAPKKRKKPKPGDVEPIDVSGATNPNAPQGARFLVIDTTPLLKESGKSWRQPIPASESVKALLDILWFKMRPKVLEHTYGDAWVLRDQQTGYVYWELATDLAAYHGLDRNPLTLEEAGIKSGSTLEVVSLRGPVIRERNQQ